MRAGHSLVMFGNNSVGNAHVRGYLVPASQVPASASAAAGTQATPGHAAGTH